MTSGRSPAQPAVQIRPYQDADRDQVMALADRLTFGVAPWRDPDAVLAAVRGWVRDSIAAVGRPDHAAYVATDGADGAEGADVVGLLTLSERTHFNGEVDVYVSELIVRADRERQGIARLLMGVAQEWAVSRGRRYLTLQTGTANQVARAAYAAMGFEDEEIQLTKEVRPVS
ncbi:MAG: GNAT family N-acetyltransferase [Streptosporangiaceae bacterium]